MPLLIHFIFTKNQNLPVAQYSFVFAVHISNIFRPDLLAIFRESYAVMFQLGIVGVVTSVVHTTP